MEIYSSAKKFRKEEKNVQEALLIGLQRLAELIKLYESQEQNLRKFIMMI